MDLARLRNIGIAAHIDAGKTTLTESILVATGLEARAGRVDEGTAVMDWMAEERERGITITAAATRVSWKGCDLNLIDTPGHVDFTVEVERCMRVLDGAILVVDARVGVQAQSETVFRQMRSYKLPALVFVNKCDRVGADMLQAVASVQERLDVLALPMHYPIYEGERMVGLVDLLQGLAWAWSGRKLELLEQIPAHVLDEAMVLRSELIDSLAEHDDALLGAVLDGREPGLEELRAVTRRLCFTGELLPVFCGVALTGLGVEPLLDGVLDYLPSPADRPTVQASDVRTGEAHRVNADPLGSPLALAFKLQRFGAQERTFLRLYRGTLVPGQVLWNPRTEREETLTGLFRQHADHGEQLDFAQAGDIVAVSGLEGTATGDTLGVREDFLALEALEVPEPVMTMMLEPQDQVDREPLGRALELLAREDPSLRVGISEDTGQWRVQGMGELHLEVAVQRLRSEFGLDPRVGAPRVSYRERARGHGRGVGEIAREVDGLILRGRVELRVEAVAQGDPPVVRWADGVQPSSEIAGAVSDAIQDAATTGPHYGFPLVGCVVHIELIELDAGEQDAAIAAHAAGRALREAFHGGGAEVELREPRMAFAVETPAEFAGGILADLGARNADVGQVLSLGLKRTIRGTVPLVRMLGYSTAVRSLSRGRANHSLLLQGFGAVSQAEASARGL
ncbi:MAG: elongation factor G [Planctomycetota bacterium]|jgi:elongation factor G